MTIGELDARRTGTDEDGKGRNHAEYNAEFHFHCYLPRMATVERVLLPSLQSRTFSESVSAIAEISQTPKTNRRIIA